MKKQKKTIRPKCKCIGMPIRLITDEVFKVLLRYNPDLAREYRIKSDRLWNEVYAGKRRLDGKFWEDILKLSSQYVELDF